MLTTGKIDRTRFSRSEDGNPFAALSAAINRADVQAAEALSENRRSRDIDSTDAKRREAHRIGLEMGFIVADENADEMDAPEGCDLDTMIREGSL